jgi:hypothetical protein
MLKKIKLSLIATFAFAFVAVPVVAPSVVSAQADIGGSLCEGANLQFNQGQDCDAQGSEEKLNSLITSIVNIFSVIVGIVAVIMIIIGGFKYITSGGDSGNVTGAKNTILYAIIGLIVVALAQFIVKFVLSKSTDVAS